MADQSRETASIELAMPEVRLATRIWYNLPRLFVRKPPFRIVFHHMPKCGGTSISYAIRRCFPWRLHNEVRITADASARAAQVVGLPLFSIRENVLLYYMAMPQMVYVSGHIPFSEAAYREHGEEWSFITIIRHPVSRWLSSYFYARRRAPDSYGSLDVQLNEHLESDAGRAWGTLTLRYFTALTNLEPSVENALQVARRFAVVGVVDDLPAFTKAFQDRFGRRLSIPHVNRNPMALNLQKQQVTTDTWRRIEEVCRPDMDLYETVVSGGLHQL